MKIGACFCIHYGREWLKWSIRSVQDEVDGVHIFYTETPSHGHQATERCPETRHDIIHSLDGLAVNWHDVGPFGWEGAHRDFAENTMFDMGYDSVLIVDADELWDRALLHRFIEFGTTSPAKIVRVGMRHFWRSLYWVCDDECAPHRMTNKAGEGETYFPMDAGRVFHMGYAQSSNLIWYKISIHGHRNEWRVGWWKDKFINWYPGCGITDVHPTNKDGFWNPVEYDSSKGYEKLDCLCFDHPYWGKDLIP